MLNAAVTLVMNADKPELSINQFRVPCHLKIISFRQISFLVVFCLNDLLTATITAI